MPFQIGGIAIHDDGQHTGNAKRGAALGIAGLDAGSKVALANIPTHGNSEHDASVRGSSGTYVGNNTVNRAIPHGMGRRPSCIVITGDGTLGSIMLINSDPGTNIIYSDYAGGNLLAVANSDATNFYVGNATSYGHSGNGSLSNYQWTAIP